MKNLLLVAVITVTTFVAGLAVVAQWPTASIPPVPEAAFSPVKKTMRPFRSEQELVSYFRELAKKQKEGRTRAEFSEAEPQGYSANQLAKATPADAKSGDKAESVTNTQHAGVDEGGIVKVHGDHLVVLRRGRLFTVKIGDNALKPVSAVDAFAPDINPESTWYDEMLVSGDSVVVIGYSYDRGGTE